jgi:hypothetical protein
MISKVLRATIKNGKIEFYDPTGSEIWLELMEGQDIEIKKVTNKRTLRQNNALHLWFELVAQEMEEAGCDLRSTIKAEITPTAYMVKELMWKPIQKKLTGKKSTSELNTDEISRIYKIMDEAMARSLKISVPFPSEPDERF